MKGSEAPAPPRYRFADLTLDVGRCRVCRGDEVIPLSKLNFDLLHVLVENAPNVVPHDQLASQVWGPRRTVTPENLAKRVNLLRQALDDRAADSRYIEGIRGRGYRLIPEVHVEAPQTTFRAAGSQATFPAAQATSPVADPQATPPTTGAQATFPATGPQVLPPAPDPQASARDRDPRDAVNDADASGTAHAGRQAGVAALRSAATEHSAARRNVLVGALAIAVGALAIDDFRLRSARRAALSASAREPSHAFELYAPRSTAFGAAPTEPQPALAPDGSALAFVAPLRATDTIWVQTLGRLDALPLPGTDHGCWPFWSADGRFVAFASHGRIRRVIAAGGAAPTEIAPLRGGYWGGAWADDDTVLYAGADGIYRVPASGGEPVQWTRLDASAGEFSHRFPVMLPDGRRFVYLVLSTQGDREGFYIGSVDDRRMKVWLRPGHSKAAVAFGADGRLRLLFVGERGQILAQAFDASHTRLTGDAVEVVPANTVEINGGVRAGAFTASARVLVYRPRVSARTRLVWRDRTGMHDETIPLPDAAYRHPALSHDGAMLTVERDALDETSGLWLVDRRRNQIRRLGPGHMSAWTPDDTRVVYSEVRPEGWHVGMKTVAEDGEGEPLVTGGHPFVKRIRDVTRSGLLFQCEVAGDTRLYYWSFTGEEAPIILPVTFQHPNHVRMSPDERWLAFSATDAGEMHVYATTFPDLDRTVRISTSQGTDPHWRSDGRELYYVTPSRTVMAVNVALGEALEVGTPVPLFNAPLDPRSLELSSAYAPAPDGRRFLLAEAADQEAPRLHVRLNWDVQGSAPRRPV